MLFQTTRPFYFLQKGKRVRKDEDEGSLFAFQLDFNFIRLEVIGRLDLISLLSNSLIS